MRPDNEAIARAEFERFLRARDMAKSDEELRGKLWDAFRWAWRPLPSTQLQVVLDGPPSHLSGRFIELVDAEGRSVRAGHWVERPNGTWALQLGGLGQKPE